MANKEKKKMSKESKIFIGIIVLIVVAIVGSIGYHFSSPGKLDAFAQCLDESDTTFYGAFWCPNCDQQKAMFGKSAQYLPYVECSTPDGQGMLEVCREAGIEVYPTWEFADGTRQRGVVPVDFLAEQTGCALPGAEAPEATVPEMEEITTEVSTSSDSGEASTSTASEDDGDDQ